MIFKKLPHNLTDFEPDICVIGAGAAGITAAIELERSGLTVVLIPGGDKRWSKRNQCLYKGETPDGYPLESHRHRRFGGTTTVWGGRCIPFDEIDFEEREYIQYSGWPISRDCLVPFYEKAQEYLDIGCNYSNKVEEVLPNNRSEMIAGFEDGKVITSEVEKFSLPTDFSKKYWNTIKRSRLIYLLLGFHCTEIVYSEAGSEVRRVVVKNMAGESAVCRGRMYILAAGGIETTRMLLQPTPTHPHGVGNQSDRLGRFFMSHLSGIISEIEFYTGVIDRYEKDDEGIYLRRRIRLSDEAQKQRKTTNFSSMLHTTPIDEPAHKNPILSTIFLLKNLRQISHRIPPEYSKRLSIAKHRPKIYLAHLKNLVLGMPYLICHMPRIAYLRLIPKRKLPSVLFSNPANRYCLHYHVEQSPHFESRITLIDERDEFGLQRVKVQFRVLDSDVEGILEAHKVIQHEFEKAGVAALTFRKDDPIADIRDQLAFGGHQIGTTRMADSPERGVVDTNCRVFGVRNLFVAGPSIFPTSGQANPMFTIVALTLRLCRHIVNDLSR